MKRESWERSLFVLVAVAFAAAIGSAVFDHPPIVLLPLSARRRSKNLENDPEERRSWRPPWLGGGHGRVALPAPRGLATKLLLAAALLVAALPAARAEAAEPDPCAGLAGAAPEVDHGELDADEWPFMELTPAVQAAARLAVLGTDPAAACGRLAPRFGDDRRAAATVLGTTLAVLADYFPERCRQGMTPERERQLLAVVERHPQAADWSPVAALHFSERGDDCPPPATSLAATVEPLGAAGSERALELAALFDDWQPAYRELLEVAAREPSLHGRIALLVAENEYGITAAVAYELAHAAAATLPAEAVETIDRHRLAALLDAGLGARALAAWDALAPQRRRELLAEPWGGDEYGDPEDRRLDLAAAALLAGRLDDAAAWFTAIPPAGETARPGTNSDPRPAVGHALAQARAGEVTSDADPFDLFASFFIASFGDDLWGRDTLLRLLVGLAERERYEAIADHLASLLAASLRDLDGEPSAFPAAMADAHRLEQAWLQELTRALPARAHRPPTRHSERRAVRRPAFEARPLADLDARPPVHPPAAADGVPLPAGFTRVRGERQGDEIVVLALSQALDPVGEVSPGGYWVLHSRDRGETWRELYTGLRVFTPWEAVGSSQLPLLAPDGVRVEVRRAELDESAIFFPPIGLALERSEVPLFLDLPWADLERDRDGDGLTDLVEERLLTDPRRPDSDGDGLGDGDDPLPGVAYRPDDGARAAAFAAFLASISNADARALLPDCPDGSDALCFGRPEFGGQRTHFVVGDAAAWSALTPAERTVVMSADEHREAEARWGPIYATEVLLFQMDHAGTRAIFVWSKRWTGGSGLAVRGPDGEWTASGSYWIT